MSAKPTANARSRPRKKRGGLGLRWLAVAALTLVGALLLSWGFSSTGAPQAESRPSSRAAASPRARYDTRAIRDIRTGHRVMADNPELADEDVPQEDITQETHRNVVFRQSKPDGSLVEFELIRSLDWIAWTGAEAGRTVALDLNEFGVEGAAEVLDVQPCPDLEHGPGRLVTGIFRHTAHNVIDVYIAGLDEPIGVTANHPFWSEDRQAFVAAAELRAGEAILQADGQPGHIVRIARTPRTATVYNIEVDGEHVYYVSRAGVVVHNMCAPKGTALDWSIVSKKTGETRIEHVIAQHGDLNLQKRLQGVFYGDPVHAIDDAWGIAQRQGITPATVGNVDIYVIPRPNSGYAGGFSGQLQNLDTVTIITQQGTNRIITGFPGNGLPLPAP